MAYIERAYLTEQFEDLLHNDNVMNPVVKVLDALEIIDTAPSADVAEVKHGKWEVAEHSAHLNVVCSNCNEDFYVYKKGQYRIDRSNYCPKCGARMDGKEGEVKAE